MAEFDVKPIAERIRRKLKRDFRHKRINAMLTDIGALAEIYYEWNQFYCDDKLEKICAFAGQYMLENMTSGWQNDKRLKKVVLYCDTFGNDTRGLSLMYLKALLTSDYKVIYVTRLDRKDEQPVLKNTLKDTGIIYEYIDFTESYSRQVKVLNDVVQRYRPDIAFLYTKPYDVAVVAVFSQYAGKIERYKINLTDHAFWLGKTAFDYCVEFRNYGASISHYKRGIEKERLISLPYYPYEDKNIVFEGLPFDEKTKYVFSGGSLYKTLGEENKYYKIVDHILKTDSTIKFLYAGSGDDSQLKLISEKYPERVVHIPERKDFVELIRRSIFYLNTYPTVGGQMMQYCALAGKLPVTLRHNQASGGLLLNQTKLAIEFDTLEEIYTEIDRLVSDEQYRHKRESALKNCVISEKGFQKALNQMINTHETTYTLEYSKIDTNEIAREYRFRINEEVLINAIAKKRHMSLFFTFPLYFLRRYWKLK